MKTKSKDILVLGTMTMDRIGLSDRITDSHFTSQIKSMESYFGGRGPNFSVYSKIFGANPILISTIGKDSDGINYRNYFKKLGISTLGLYDKTSKGTDNFFLFKEDKKGRAFFYNAADHQSKGFKEHIKRVISSSKNYAAMYCTWPLPEPNRLALSSKKPSENALRVFSPAHNLYLYTNRELVECLRNTDILILNEHEYGVLREHFRNSSELRKRFGISIIMITLGDGGTVILHDGKKIYIPAFAAERVVDTTGAGDAFAAAFLSNYIKTGNIEKSAKIASVTASFVVEKVGCQTNVPTRREIQMRLKKNKIIKADVSKILGSVK